MSWSPNRHDYTDYFPVDFANHGVSSFVELLAKEKFHAVKLQRMLVKDFLNPSSAAEDHAWNGSVGTSVSTADDFGQHKSLAQTSLEGSVERMLRF